MRTTPTRVARLRDELAERQAQREATKLLRRELASYRTPSEVNDLLAAIGDQDTPDAEEIRSILLGNTAQRRTRWTYAS